MKLPQRPNSHVLEELSNRFFQTKLPTNWTTTKPLNDYGIDFIVNIFDGLNASHYELNIQLKSSQKSTGREYEKIALKTTTYNHLWHQLHVVMLIKYVAEENEAYWILLIDVKPPKKNSKSFTVYLPKNNKLSTIKWPEIEDYIREIVDYKLDAGDVIRNRRINKLKRL